MLTHNREVRDGGAGAADPYNPRATHMGDHPADHSSVDAFGIRPPAAFAIEAREPSDGILVLSLEGEFDLAAAPALKEQLDAARTRADRGVVCDCSGVTFVDSAGLREFLRAGKALGADGKSFALAALQPPVIRLLELTGATDAIDTAPTLERALRQLAEQP